MGRKGWPAFALHPLSLAMMTLFRGSAYAWTRGYRVSKAVTAVSPAASTAAGKRPALRDSDLLQDSGGKVRRWEIPWGNIPWGKHKPILENEDTLMRTFEVLPGAVKDVEESDCFRVLSFNMLAQPMANSEMFPYVPKSQLKKKNRLPRVQEEVSRYGADVICLQECDSFEEILASLQVDEDQSYLQGSLHGTQFEGFAKMRSDKDNSHGVAILYDSKIFRLIDSAYCAWGKELFGGGGAFALLEDRRRAERKKSKRGRRHAGSVDHLDGHDVRRADPTSDINSRPIGSGGGGGDDVSDKLSGGEVGTEGRALGEDEGVAATEETAGIICVATTHLYWHPDGGAIRLAQAEIVLTGLKEFLRERFGDAYLSIPVVLAGDLNTVPGVDVFKLLSDGFCESGTPAAFFRRKREKNLAKRVEDAEKARQAAAVIEKIRARNAAVISATKRGERPPTPAAAYEVGDTAETAAASDGGVEEAAAVKAAQGRGGATVAISRAALGGGLVTSGAAPVSGSGTATPSDDAAVGAVGGGDGAPATSATTAAAAGSHWNTAASKAAHTSYSDASNSTRSQYGEGAAPAPNTPEGDRDEDVRRYEQGFRGLSSAYGAYSSVFGSQLSRTHPCGELSVCEATGFHTIGHVRLGVRQGTGHDGGIRPLPQEESERQDNVQQRQQESGPLGEPQLTTCTNQFAGTIDYIWHTPQLQVRSLLELPSLEQAMSGGGLPTSSYPSDHLSIMAELHWRDTAAAADGGDDAPKTGP